jgi:2-polyprenyl-3-methyl-5-hydroxy-6-metoxy-1,4-benzoquinol methylase
MTSATAGHDANMALLLIEWVKVGGQSQITTLTGNTIMHSMSNGEMAALEKLAIRLNWYHSIELHPGFVTPGHGFTNIVITREILKRCEIQGMTCLDVGAMDGLMAAILCRRDAGQVVACDRYKRQEQIDIVRKALGVNFKYLPDSTLADVRAATPGIISNPFDLIVFSGVLYHMYDPMQGLAIVRSMVRTGGIVVIETGAAVSEKNVGYFNAAGANDNDPHNYWTLSLSLLDYMLRYFCMKPVDCSFFPYPAKTEDGSQLIRIAIACIATEKQLPDPQDKWMVYEGRDDDSEYTVWNSPITRELKYQSMSSNKPAWRTPGMINLYRTVLQSSPTAITDDLRKLSLGVDC